MVDDDMYQPCRTNAVFVAFLAACQCIEVESLATP